MKTVKELSNLTGISVRTLHYYDEIGLFKPTQTTDAGYRLYDEEALQKLQHILLFKELDIPLKDIITILKNQNYEQTKVLSKQRDLLTLKRDRLNGLIELIDKLIMGEHPISFQEFSTEEIDTMFQSMLSNLNKEQLETINKEYGNVTNWEKVFKETITTPSATENLSTLTQWYGSKDAVLEAVQHPFSTEDLTIYQKTVSDIYEKIASLQFEGINSRKISNLVNQYLEASAKIYHMDHPEEMLIELAKLYQTNSSIIEVTDSMYGTGSSIFIGEAIIYNIKSNSDN